MNLRYGRVDASPSPGPRRDAPRRRPDAPALGPHRGQPRCCSSSGFLVVVQLNVADRRPGPQRRCPSQELTELVANLTTRNNQLREEIATLERQRDAGGGGRRSAATPRPSRSGPTSTASSAGPGACAVTGAGIRVTVDGPLPGDALEQLLNELRNAGAEAIAIGDVRIVPGVVATGPAGDGASSRGVPLARPDRARGRRPAADPRRAR